MVLLCLSGSFIFWLPFFLDVYYVPMQRAFEFSNTQLGMLASTFGLVSLLSYAPGGWLADRYPARLLMSTALAISGMGGFVFAQFPSFEVCLMLYGLCLFRCHFSGYLRLARCRFSGTFQANSIDSSVSPCDGSAGLGGHEGFIDGSASCAD